MHCVLFNNRRNLGTTSLKLYSKEAGVKNKKFLDDLVNGVYGWQIQDDLKEGHSRGVKELPAFFINEEVFSGKPTFANLSEAIDKAIRKSKSKSKTPVKVAPKVTASRPAEKSSGRASSKSTASAKQKQKA